MPPTVHCIRHAQGYHNLNAANHNMHDPLLTVLGHEQCKTLGRDFPYSSNVDLIVASPIKRTIYTALEAFEEIIRKKGLKVVALPEVQETSDLPCDTGSDRAELEREFEGRPIDLDLVHEGWNNKRGKWAPTAAAIQNRAREGRVWLMNRPEKEIVIVTHGPSQFRSPNVPTPLTPHRWLFALFHRRLVRHRPIRRHRLEQHRIQILHFLLPPAGRSTPD